MAAANPWKRLGVLFAGPLMNFLVGILIFSVVFSQVGKPDTKTVQVIEVNASSPAESVGLLPGDVIKAVDGQTITALDQVGNLVRQKMGQAVELTIERDGEILQFSIVPRTEYPEGEGPMGVVTSNPTISINWFQAVPYALQWTGETSAQFITLPVRLIRGEISSEQARLVSPIGLYSIYSQARASQAEEEAKTPGLAILDILWFFGNISVLLGLSNLLPIPALDGGRMLFVLPEIILRKRIPPKYENAINFVCFLLLLILMAFLFVQDIVHPVVLP
jgi:regulator of sigma E protease